MPLHWSSKSLLAATNRPLESSTVVAVVLLRGARAVYAGARNIGRYYEMECLLQLSSLGLFGKVFRYRLGFSEYVCTKAIQTASALVPFFVALNGDSHL